MNSVISSFPIPYISANPSLVKTPDSTTSSNTSRVGNKMSNVTEYGPAFFVLSVLASLYNGTEDGSADFGKHVNSGATKEGGNNGREDLSFSRGEISFGWVPLGEKKRGLATEKVETSK